MSDTKITMPYGTGKTVGWNVLNEFIRQSSELYADDEFKSAGSVKACSNCKWHEDFTGACCNGDSEYRADFTGSDFVCDKWEERENE